MSVGIILNHYFQGVIRQLPLMGSLYNWWSPLDKEAHAIKGRSFDLKTGQIQATDVMYTLRRTSSVNAAQAPQVQKVSISLNSSILQKVQSSSSLANS